jgi:arylsulfatase A-like enzyme
MIPLLVALAACTGSDPFTGPRPPPAPTFTDPGLSTTGASPVHQLWRIEGRYQLPETVLPDGFEATSAFPVVLDPSPVEEKTHVNVYSGRSPFREDLDGRRSAPPGMSLELDGEALPYAPALGRPSWAIRDGKLFVAVKGELTADKVKVRYDGAEETLLRRDPGTANLPDAEFVRYEVTLGTRTRPGMLLPAPGAASFDLTLPDESPVFDTWLAMAPAPLRDVGSDGAYVVVSVTHQGATEVAGSKTFVYGETDDFQHVRIDLSKWKGQQVTLTVTTDPYGHNHFDHVFLGSPTVFGAASGEPRRVIVVGLDTTRPQSFSYFGYERATTPELDEVMRQSVVFDQAWTPAPRTRPSFRSATTGRRPLDAVGAKNIGQVFSEHGFATAGITANVHLQPRFDFHHGFDDWWFDGQSRADSQVDRALAFLDLYQERDVYMFLHIMDPHMPYNAPGSYENMFVPAYDPELPNYFARSTVYGWMRQGPLSSLRKEHIRGLYDGEMRYMSTHLARFFEQLDKLGGKTLVIVHNDHGEEFWEHGQFEHNHTLYDDVTRGLLWVRAGSGQADGHRVSAPATLADIAPTLYDFVGFDDAPPTDGQSLRPFLDGGADPSSWSDRPIGIAHLRYGYDRWAVVWQGKKYILHTGSGVEELYDLTADPAESDDLARRTDLSPWRERLGPVHGMEAGRGWRVRVEMEPGGQPVRMALPAAAKGAIVVPPSMTIPNPRNQAWGEPPRRTPADIGTVELVDEGRTLVFTPGTDPTDGLLFVLFGDDVSPNELSATRGDDVLVFRRGASWQWRSGKQTLSIEPGTVFLPPPSEADRMKAAQGTASEEQIRELCALGYLHGEICGDEEGEH